MLTEESLNAALADAEALGEDMFGFARFKPGHHAVDICARQSIEDRRPSWAGADNRLNPWLIDPVTRLDALQDADQGF